MLRRRSSPAARAGLPGDDPRPHATCSLDAEIARRRAGVVPELVLSMHWGRSVDRSQRLRRLCVAPAAVWASGPSAERVSNGRAGAILDGMRARLFVMATVVTVSALGGVIAAGGASASACPRGVRGLGMVAVVARGRVEVMDLATCRTRVVARVSVSSPSRARELAGRALPWGRSLAGVRDDGRGRVAAWPVCVAVEGRPGPGAAGVGGGGVHVGARPVAAVRDHRR